MKVEVYWLKQDHFGGLNLQEQNGLEDILIGIIQWELDISQQECTSDRMKTTILFCWAGK